jgi:hypothetical protein
MRILSIAVVVAVFAAPTICYAQDQGLVGGKVGPNLESSSSSSLAQPGSSGGEEGFGSRPRAPQEHPGFSGAVSPGQVVNRNTPIIAQPGGMGVAFVNGQRVKVDLSSGRIMSVGN